MLFQSDSMLLTAPSVWAEDEEEGSPSYTRVGLWQVERNQWGEFVEFFEKQGHISEADKLDQEVLRYAKGMSLLHSDGLAPAKDSIKAAMEARSTRQMINKKTKAPALRVLAQYATTYEVKTITRIGHQMAGLPG